MTRKKHTMKKNDKEENMTMNKRQGRTNGNEDKSQG